MCIRDSSSIDQEQYEAARVDGANRFQQMLHITLPGLVPTIMILFILRMGNILNVGYEKILLLYNSATYSTADVISTYTYRLSFGGDVYKRQIIKMLCLKEKQKVSQFVSRKQILRLASTHSIHII